MTQRARTRSRYPLRLVEDVLDCVLTHVTGARQRTALWARSFPLLRLCVVAILAVLLHATAGRAACARRGRRDEGQGLVGHRHRRRVVNPAELLVGLDDLGNRRPTRSFTTSRAPPRHARADHSALSRHPGQASETPAVPDPTGATAVTDGEGLVGAAA
jgi:hypothetical protein